MELTSHHQPEEFREGQKETLHVQSTSQNPSRWTPYWLSNAHTTRKEPKSEWLARDNPETNPITIKIWDCEPPSRVVLLGSFTLLLSAQAPFSNKVSYLSARVPPQTIHFQVLDKNPFWGPGRDPPSCNILSVISGSYMFLGTLPFRLTFISWNIVFLLHRVKGGPVELYHV